MANADNLFISMCKNIIDNGTKVPSPRAKWEDGTPANTIKNFGVINKYDLSKEFPAMTLRPVGFKNCIDEILWIYQKKSNNIKDLNSHIWDQWADDNGEIGQAYGWQIANKFREINGVEYDQIDYVIHELKNNPFSRRIIIDMYSINDLKYMNLDPCAYSITFNVTKDKIDGELVLNAILNQRSQDILVANNWNVVQYSVLVHMLAHVCNLKVGTLIHIISDAHIYDRHIPIVEELITRPTYDSPLFTLNTDVKDFYDFKIDDFKLINYKTNPQIKNIPVAI